ncbi:polysaccharide deacetylase family protein [Actinomadura parmotrematis]|uniref:Polysaccharide deacetylase family protein n=1 Tax=Actinomadura parmotrematis TaxID=2864039 RepID=A0ABS7G4G5_9ACTN|nr:polysaccharide deacetylase family protein [Actinomadura parmotrematis]MBW8486518.1 polysaccharide deacetylase family protein [Actinomadura parmotrematis]
MGRTADAPPPGAAAGPPGRRSLLRGLALGAGGAVLGGAGGIAGGRLMAEDEVPASAASVDSWEPPERQVDIVWSVDTAARLVALTFDDGPLPKWTPMALDVLDEARIPATFFMVGSRLAAHAGLVRGRLGRHEVGNHTWRHDDLSRLSRAAGYRTVHRTHAAIAAVTGREPVLLRPPWGRMGGTTVHVAAQHGYDIALWSLLVQDRALHRDPQRMIDDVVQRARPGTVLLAHDVGQASRLEAVRRLPAMIAGLRGRGFSFVTLSELRRAAARSGGRAAPAAP